MALDLEFNKPITDIIEIGAAIGDTTTGKVLDTFSVFVYPSTPVSEYITNLTSITNQDIQTKGMYISAAYDKLVAFHGRYGASPNVVTWGGGDMEMLKLQANIQEWNFSRRYTDVKTLHCCYQIANGKSPQAGLSKAMNKMGLTFEGKKHRAVDDAVNTLKMYFKMLEVLRD